jgi:DNA-directed RNA polymerase subunit K/omega
MDIERWDRAKAKIGNTFELTVLIQKRVRELIKDRQRPLVELDTRNPIQIALEEILQDKIYLAPGAAPTPQVVRIEDDLTGPNDNLIDPTAAPEMILDTEDLSELSTFG